MAVSVLGMRIKNVSKNTLFRGLFRSGVYPTDFYYLIVFTQTYDQFNEAEIDAIFIDCYKEAMLDVNILFPYSNESMMMTTYIPFENDCVKLTRRDLGILSEWECESELSESMDDVFPKKGLNMHKCTVNVATFPSEPCVIFRKLNETTHDVDVEGIEIELLQQMAKVLNFTVHFKSPADKQKRGVIGHNGTSTGCFRMVNICCSP